MNLSPQLPAVDLFSTRFVYFVGIKGVGMTALAVLLADAGIRVQGADVAEEFVTDEQLHTRSIQVDDFASAVLPADVEAVVYSGAHQGRNHPLVQEALQRGLPCLNLAEAVGRVSQKKQTIAVCGVGGKSTTSALLSWILEYAGLSPSFAVGVGGIPNLGTTARWQSAGTHLVIEADEYVADPQVAKQEQVPRFLYLFPSHSLCTSLTYDHPDVYASFAETQAAFRALFAKIPPGGNLVVNGDDAGLLALAGEFPALHVLSVGSSEHNTIRLQDFRVENGNGVVLVHGQNESFEIMLSVPGFHNLRNAAYAAVFARQLGVEVQTIQEAIAQFRSTARRFELVGVTPEGLRCYDDYAHHPRELTAIAETLTAWFPDERVAVAFQPHTYSRTKALFADFVEALAKMPGEVLLLPIFSSAREGLDPSISSEQLAQALVSRGKSALALQNQAELLEYIQRLARSEDQDADQPIAQPRNVFITLGAGDIYKVYEQLTFRPTEAAIS